MPYEFTLFRPDPNIPWWCGISDWTGGWAESCRVPTEAEIRAAQAAGMGPVMTPISREAALQAGDRATAVYCEMHPIECEEFQGAAEPCSSLATWSLDCMSPLTWGLLAAGGFLLLRATR